MTRNRQIVILVALVAVAIVVWSFEWDHHAPATQAASSIEHFKVLAVENPQIRWDELRRVRDTEYKSNGRNPFSVIAPPTPKEIQAKLKLETQVKNTPPPPPPKPTVAIPPPNLKYFGYGTLPAGSTRRAFFTDGEDIFIVTEGDTLLGRYRILKVGNSNLEFQEISSGLHGTMPLEEPPSSPSA
ncbi:MAG: hypothetical protein WA829_19360 [Candidatus Acidiferrum sp.]